LVFEHSLALDSRRRLRAGRNGRRLSIRLRASRCKHIVGARPSPADDGVRRLIDGCHFLFESLIRLLAFDAQAFVGLFAL
jgi:hypothetical protein